MYASFLPPTPVVIGYRPLCPTFGQTGWQRATLIRVAEIYAASPALSWLEIKFWPSQVRDPSAAFVCLIKQEVRACRRNGITIADIRGRVCGHSLPCSNRRNSARFEGQGHHCPFRAFRYLFPCLTLVRWIEQLCRGIF